MNKLRTLFHPIIVFIGIQIAWVTLMAVWIYWYVTNSRNLKDFAQKLSPELFSTDFDWLVLLEGCLLMLVILTGVYVIFIYWNKQERLNRLQSNFVSSVSHELKSPLASIQLYLETLKYQEMSRDEANDFVETMLSDTERLSGLVDNILESSKSDPKTMQLQFQPMKLDPFLNEILSGYRRRFYDKGIEMKVDIKDSPTLELDKRAMRMVFSNLIGNALRYSPRESVFSINGKKSRNYYQIEFADQGVGVSKSEVKKIFRKFYRVQNHETHNIEGAGLGLFISKELVKRHGGKISVSSEGMGLGSVFTILLPLEPADKPGFTEAFARLFG